MIEKPTLLSQSFRFITIAMLITWLILPLIPLAIWSFAKGWFFPLILPKYWSLNAWNYALSDTAGVLDSLLLTIFISSVANYYTLPEEFLIASFAHTSKY